MAKVDYSIIGKRFGRLVVLGRDESWTGRKIRWLCRCDCGNTCAAFGDNLVTENTRSCGCLRRETTTIQKTKHGLFHTALWDCWQHMVQRCTNPKVARYPAYGGRGIRVCDRRLRSIVAFSEDMGPMPSPKHQIDRIDNDGNYEPENCRWATRTQQARNRRTSKRIVVNGESITLAEASERFGINYGTLRSRIVDYGWSIHDATRMPRYGRWARKAEPI